MSSQLASLPLIDGSIIVIYMIVVLALGLWVGRHKNADVTEYFLAGRKLTWPVIGLTLFGTNISSVQIVGQAGLAYSIGIAAGNPQLVGGLFYIFVAVAFAPLYLRQGLFTVPEFLGRRYGTESRMILSVVSMISYILIGISVTLFAGGTILNVLMGWNIQHCILLLAGVTACYTIFGGFRAVAITDTVQSFVFLLGGAAVFFIGLHHVGGWNEMVARVGAAHMELIKPASDPNMPWTGVFSGLIVAGIFYGCADQHMAQSILAAKNVYHARMGAVMAGFLKIAAIFFIVAPGLIALALYPGEFVKNNNAAYPNLVLRILPTGFVGLVLAGIMAAIMSTLDSAFCATSTLFAHDFYRRFKPAAGDRELVLVGRIVGVVVFMMGILWAQMIGNFGNIFNYMLICYAFIGSPFAACYLFGIWTRWATRKACFVSVAVGISTGFFLLAARLLNQATQQAALTGASAPRIWLLSSAVDMLPGTFVQAHFWHQNLVVFALSVLAILVVSPLTKKPTADQLSFILSTGHEIKEPKCKWYTSFGLWCGLYLASLVAMYLIF